MAARAVQRLPMTKPQEANLADCKTASHKLVTCSGFTYPNSSGLVTPPQFCNPRPITFNHARIVCKLSCNLYDPASPHQDLGKWQRTAFISKRACSSQAILQLNMSGSCAILRYLTHDEGMSRSYIEPMPLVVVWVNKYTKKEHRTSCAM